MKKYFSFLLFLSLLFVGCDSSNIEEKYPVGDNPNPGDPLAGEIAYFPLNGNLNDSSGNNTPLNFIGELAYIKGLNSNHGKGLSLDGKSYLLLPVGYHDTLSLVFWVKGAGDLAISNKPVLVDYGNNSISATLSTLDASSGPTILTIQNNGSEASSADVIEALNSWTEYSFFYFEVSNGLTRIYYKTYFPGGKEKLYKKDYVFPGVIDPKTEILYIGRTTIQENIPNSMFKGNIDEIHIYNRRLTDTEINTFANIVPE